MKSYEMVEKLSEKTGITLERAKDVLERAEWDMLDAMIILEKENKAKKSDPVVQTQPPVNELPAMNTAPNTQGTSNCGAQYAQQAQPTKTTSFSEHLGRFCGAVKRFLQKSIDNSFVITKNNKQVAAFPVLVLVILLMCCFWTVIPAMIIGLFFDLNYSFSGPVVSKATLNDVMDKASQVTGKIRSDFRNGMNDTNK